MIPKQTRREILKHPHQMTASMGHEEKYQNDEFIRVDDMVNFLNNLDLNVFDAYTIMHISNSLLSQSNKEVEDGNKNN